MNEGHTGRGWAGKPSTEEHFPALYVLLTGHPRERMSKRIRLTKKVHSVQKRETQFLKEQTNKRIGYDYSRPLPIFLEHIMDEIVEQSTKAGYDSYSLLKHFQFTDAEIEEYFERLGRDIP